MFSESSSLSGQVVDNVFLFILAITIVLLILITFLMIYFVVKYRRKKNPSSANIKGNTRLEIVWTVVPVVIVLAMFYYGWTGFDFLRSVPNNAMVVKVKSQMWSWSFEYENGMQSDVLTVPIGKPVKLVLTSRDVIHGFFIPAFRIKQDAVPGMENYVWFESTALGAYDILCTQYCGLRHSYMSSKVVVVPEKEFKEWYDSTKPSEEKTEEKEGQTQGQARQTSRGLKLLKTKGCLTCHTTDGSPLVGPSIKGIFGQKTTVITDGKEREVVVDEEYLRKSILEPNADVVRGFQPIMPSQKDALTEDEITEIIKYLKQLK